MYQRKSGSSSCNCVLGDLSRRENVAFKFASIAAAIRGEEGAWLMGPMVAVLLVIGSYPHHEA